MNRHEDLSERFLDENKFDRLLAMGAEAVPLCLRMMATLPNPPIMNYTLATMAMVQIDGPTESIADGRMAMARRLAAVALGQLKDSRAVEPLICAANDEADPELQLEAVWALGEIADRRAIPTLIPLVLGSRIAGAVKFSDLAVEALQKLGQGDLANALQRALRRDTDAIAILAEHPRDEVLTLFLRAMDDPDQQLAANAAWALGEFGFPEALPHLQHRADNYLRPDMEVEAASTRALAKLQARLALPRAVQDQTSNMASLPRAAGPAGVRTEELPVASMPSCAVNSGEARDD